SSPTTKSSFSPGFSQVDNSLNYPWGTNDQAAVTSAKALITNGIPFMNQHIMAWGVDDIWPDPSTADPSNWSPLDTQMQIVQSTGVTPVITFAEAPWWMKGQVQSDGTTKLIPDSRGEWASYTYTTSYTDYRGITYPAGYVSPGPYDSRILDNQMSNWLHLVDSVARRYMVSPYNVRYFQVWNELKGYYNPATNQYDSTTSAGDPTGSNAKHGYTYMYNQVYTRIMQVANSLGIATSSVFVGGPYVVIDTWGSGSGGFPTTEAFLKNKAYGNYDQRGLDVVKYWLQKKAGAGFVTVDAGNDNKDGINLTDPFTASQKFADVTNWIHQLNTAYPGSFPDAATMPVWWAEWYASPLSNYTQDYNNAVKSYAMSQLLKAGGAVALAWGEQGDSAVVGGGGSAGIYSNTNQSGGGQPYSWYYSYKAFRDYFPPGTQLYATSISAPTQVEALASATKTMLINKTAGTLTVGVNGTIVPLNPYRVLVK
ncbi:MAG: hypothetical protein ACJ8DI_28385, partial [Ktedonobacteraceae bacterium]